MGQWGAPRPAGPGPGAGLPVGPRWGQAAQKGATSGPWAGPMSEAPAMKPLPAPAAPGRGDLTSVGGALPWGFCLGPTSVFHAHVKMTRAAIALLFLLSGRCDMGSDFDPRNTNDDEVSEISLPRWGCRRERSTLRSHVLRQESISGQTWHWLLQPT